MWFPWWPGHGPMGPLEGTFLKVNVDRLDFRIYTILRLLADPAVLVNPSNFQLCSSDAPRSSWKPFIVTEIQVNAFGWLDTCFEAPGMSFSCRCGILWFLVRSKIWFLWFLSMRSFGLLPVVICPLFSSSCLSGLTRLWPCVCVCVWVVEHLNRCKTSRGGQWLRKTPPRDPWKRTCKI